MLKEAVENLGSNMSNKTLEIVEGVLTVCKQVDCRMVQNSCKGFILNLGGGQYSFLDLLFLNGMCMMFYIAFYQPRLAKQWIKELSGRTGLIRVNIMIPAPIVVQVVATQHHDDGGDVACQP